MNTSEQARIPVALIEARPRDWKTNIALLIGIVGLVSPIGLWQYDLLASTSISTKVISSIPLVFNQVPTVNDIEVRLDGRTVDTPYVSTIAITNDGSKPIPTASFEAPLEVVVNSGAKMVRAKISQTDPPELTAKVVTNENGFRLEPLLLNQGDTLKVVVITSTAAPTFTVKGRINSIRRLELTDATEKSPGVGFKIRQAILFLLAAFIYPTAMTALARRSRISNWTLLGVGAVSALAFAESGKQLARIYDLEKWRFIAFEMGLVGLFFIWSRWRSRRTASQL